MKQTDHIKPVSKKEQSVVQTYHLLDSVKHPISIIRDFYHLIKSDIYASMGGF